MQIITNKSNCPHISLSCLTKVILNDSLFFGLIWWILMRHSIILGISIKCTSNQTLARSFGIFQLQKFCFFSLLFLSPSSLYLLLFTFFSLPPLSSSSSSWFLIFPGLLVQAATSVGCFDNVTLSFDNLGQFPVLHNTNNTVLHTVHHFWNEADPHYMEGEVFRGISNTGIVKESTGNIPFEVL